MFILSCILRIIFGFCLFVGELLLNMPIIQNFCLDFYRISVLIIFHFHRRCHIGGDAWGSHQLGGEINLEFIPLEERNIEKLVLRQKASTVCIFAIDDERRGPLLVNLFLLPFPPNQGSSRLAVGKQKPRVLKKLFFPTSDLRFGI